MKLSETTFIVRVNKAFIKKLNMKPKQLAWFVREAAKGLDESMWDANLNAGPEGFDCWNHDILVKTGKNAEKFIIEAVPYPKGVLILAVRGVRETYPLPIVPGDADVMEMLYPDIFEGMLALSEAELQIERAEVPDGQHRFKTS